MILALIITASAGCTRQTADQDLSVERSFGQRQLEQMLEDRPDMKDVLSPSHPVVKWLIERFDGKRLGQRIYWNASSPMSGRPAEHGLPYGPYPPYISISGGTETTPIDKWAMVVYEMFNLENNDEFKVLLNQALDGSLDANGFAERSVQLEFVALKKTQKFFRENPIPASKHDRDKWYDWVLSDIGSFESYKTAFDVPGMNSFNSNFEYFKTHYETTIVPYVDAMRRKKR